MSHVFGCRSGRCFLILLLGRTLFRGFLSWSAGDSPRSANSAFSAASLVPCTPSPGRGGLLAAPSKTQNFPPLLQTPLYRPRKQTRNSGPVFRSRLDLCFSIGRSVCMSVPFCRRGVSAEIETSCSLQVSHLHWVNYVSEWFAYFPIVFFL